MTCIAPCLAVEILDQGAFHEHAAAWDQLLQRSFDNRIFLTSAWHQLWWRQFGRGEAQVLVIRDDDGDWQGALPLQIRDLEGVRVLSLVGDHNLTDYMDALAEKPHAEEVLAVLWRHALRELNWDRLELRHLPANSAMIPVLQALGEELGIAMQVSEDEICPLALLCSSWEGYLQMLSKKQRHEIRRKLRRAQDGVEWGWRTAGSARDLDRDLPSFFRLHEAGARDKAAFMTPARRRFFTDVANQYLRAGMLRLSIFSRQGEDIAATFSFLYRDRYLLYNSGYDPTQAIRSPGIAAVAHAMQDAIEEKAVAFDFLSGEEPYKYQFGASNTYTLRISASRR